MLTEQEEACLNALRPTSTTVQIDRHLARQEAYGDRAGLMLLLMVDHSLQQGLAQNDMFTVCVPAVHAPAVTC